MSDADFMRGALGQARAALSEGEVPVGAVVVRDGVVIASGRNASRASSDPTAHAEIVALRAAAQFLGNYRLEDCDLYVTLEPCAMCCGAMLHARLRRVVFGAPDPKTGAAGSVLNLFEQSQLNHQTRLCSNLLAQECGELLQNFFRNRREQARHVHAPVREDALRTPESRFEALGPSRWLSRYTLELPSLAGLRLHYWDEVSGSDATAACLCLHGRDSWSRVFEDRLDAWLQTGLRVLVPDLIGFGRSDKPKKESFHSLAWHAQVLTEFAQRFKLRRMLVLTQASMLPLGQLLMALDAECFARLQVLDDLPELQGDMAAAPYPDRGHGAALRAFPGLLVPAGDAILRP